MILTQDIFDVKQFETVGDLIDYLKTLDPDQSVCNSYAEPLRTVNYGTEIFYNNAIVFEPDTEYVPESEIETAEKTQ